MSATRDHDPPHAGPASRPGAPTAGRQWSARRGFVIALFVSIAIHAALSFVPDEIPTAPERTILAATLRELPPPPPLREAQAPAKPTPKPRPAVPRSTLRAPAGMPERMAEPEAFKTPEAFQGFDESSIGVAAAPEPAPAPQPVLAQENLPDFVPTGPKTLPPRVDLAYRVFFGTQGFEIGRATYRFEHAGSRYRIATVAEASGLAALLFRGKGRMESSGLITASGLKPYEFVVDKFNRRGAERAEFDWEAGIVRLHESKIEALDLPTFDLLALMWQFYFQPPGSGLQTFSIATTRRINRVTLTREREETIEWAHGMIATEVWHRTSQDGRTEAHVWLAPSLHWIPVKMRIVNTQRGTVEAVLGAIRVDEPGAHYAGETGKPLGGEPDLPLPETTPTTRARLEIPYSELATQ